MDSGARQRDDAVSELERSVLDDIAALGIVRDALLSLFFQQPDLELAMVTSARLQSFRLRAGA